jgi:hypothetical protein
VRPKLSRLTGHFRRFTARNRRSKSLRSRASPRYRSVRDINRYRNASASQRIIRLRSDRGTVYGVPGRAYATRLKPCGDHGAHRAERPSTSLAGLREKANLLRANGEIAAGRIRPYSRTQGSRSVLRCTRHTRCRGPRARAIPWQKPLLQRSECAGTGRHL